VAKVSAAISLVMSADIEHVVKSKQAFRTKLAASPIAEKLRMLDALRERALAIRASSARATNVVRENPPKYDSQREANE